MAIESNNRTVVKGGANNMKTKSFLIYFVLFIMAILSSACSQRDAMRNIRNSFEEDCEMYVLSELRYQALVKTSNAVYLCFDYGETYDTSSVKKHIIFHISPASIPIPANINPQVTLEKP